MILQEKNKDKIKKLFRFKVDVCFVRYGCKYTGIKDIDAIYTGELCMKQCYFQKKF